MAYVHRTLIVPAQLAPMIRGMCIQLAGSAGDNMFTRGLSPNGRDPVTHYISTGMIEDTFGYVLSSPEAMYSACTSAGVEITLEECIYILSSCFISEDDPWAVLSREHLLLIQETL